MQLYHNTIQLNNMIQLYHNITQYHNMIQYCITGYNIILYHDIIEYHIVLYDMISCGTMFKFYHSCETILYYIVVYILIDIS